VSRRSYHSRVPYSGTSRVDVISQRVLSVPGCPGTPDCRHDRQLYRQMTVLVLSHLACSYPVYCQWRLDYYRGCWLLCRVGRLQRRHGSRDTGELNPTSTACRSRCCLWHRAVSQVTAVDGSLTGRSAAACSRNTQQLLS